MANAKFHASMFIGAVKWFDNGKGFGLVSLPGGGTIFFHKRSFEGKLHSLSPGNVVTGTTKSADNRHGMEIKNCHLASSPTDWPMLLGLLGKPDTVEIDDADNRTRGKHNKPRKQSLVRLCLDQYCRSMEASRLLAMATTNVEEIVKTPGIFMQFAGVLEASVLRNFGNETALNLLENIFSAFGQLITPAILFAVWKTGNFKYIGYPRHGDYEIPEELLAQYMTDLGYRELSRIKEYSFGEKFCREVALTKLSNTKNLPPEQHDERSQYLDFLPLDERGRW